MTEQKVGLFDKYPELLMPTIVLAMSALALAYISIGVANYQARVNAPVPLGPDDRPTMTAPAPDDICFTLNNPLEGYPGKYDPDLPEFHNPQAIIVALDKLGVEMAEVEVRRGWSVGPYDPNKFYKNGDEFCEEPRP